MAGDPATAAPRILLVNSNKWAVAARLAIGLSNAGCVVSALCPSGHPLALTKAVGSQFPYSALRPLDSLARAIGAVDPHFIVPSDDVAVGHLHELHARSTRTGVAGKRITTLIERSLGPQDGYATVSTRYALLEVAAREGLRVAHTARLESRDDLDLWCRAHPSPWVLKADGTCSGRGVRIVRTREEARRAFDRLARLFGTADTMRRFVADRDRFSLRSWWDGRRPSIVGQSYVPGKPANCAVFCWEGTVLAGVAAEAVSTQSPTGPASVVRIVDNAEMMGAADVIARRLGLSGFFGLDFILEAETGCAYLIEMNPRCTPLCHLRLGASRDMVEALYARLCGRPAREVPAVTDNDLIAYFPDAWQYGGEFLDRSYRDAPLDEPALMQALLKVAKPGLLRRPFGRQLRRAT